MVFNSTLFFLFFGAVLFLHNLPLSWRARKVNLLIASIIFYGAYNPFYVVLIAAAVTAGWLVAARMPLYSRTGGRRWLMALSLTIHLGMLSYFKYGQFFLDNFVALARMVHLHYQPPADSIILPVGISFYTFHILSYTIDVFRDRIKPCPSLLDFALYVTFFPLLVAGPIVRGVDLLPQFQEPKKADARQLGWGFSLLVIGIFQKKILADFLLAPVVDQLFGQAQEAGALASWTAAMGFSCQLFYDFAGYSSAAIGAGLCLGFALPDNFRSPYASIGFREFWTRWHISLSSWLRDYLYISLGGNRKGARRTYINLMVTMLLGGLWHGSSWRFVVWGGLHGLFLMVERFLKGRVGGAEILTTAPARILLGLLTYALTCVAWVFFRASGFGDAFAMVSSMTGLGSGNIVPSARQLAVVAGMTLYILGSHWMLRGATLEQAAEKVPAWAKALILSALIMALILAPGDNRAFIYFQF